MKKFLTSLFSTTAADMLKKGDGYYDTRRYFEARTCYEDGLQKCRKETALHDFAEELEERIERSNSRLAELNLHEAESALLRGDSDKAIDHLELVKTLTYDESLREKAEEMLRRCSPVALESDVPASAHVSPSSCSSCSSSLPGEDPHVEDSAQPLDMLEYYSLLIQQLPEDQRRRYAALGENFAYAYVAASGNRNEEALILLEKCSAEVDRDIFDCEKGKIIYRLARQSDAERCFRQAITGNPRNSLAWLNLSLLLAESSRIDEALDTTEQMIAGDLMPEQAALMRAELLDVAGRRDEALETYTSLLSTSYARSAAEALHGLLVSMGREQDAAFVFKKYLGSCRH
ncbi:MAG: tetratricopeptide repeat protein [Desulfuromonadales bacterium]